MLKTTTQWQKFDKETFRNFNEDGTYAEGVDHKTSIKHNLKAGLFRVAMSPITPLLGVFTIPFIKDAGGVATLLAGMLYVPFLTLAQGLKDLAVDIPMHGAAMLFKKD